MIKCSPLAADGEGEGDPRPLASYIWNTIDVMI